MSKTFSSGKALALAEAEDVGKMCEPEDTSAQLLPANPFKVVYHCVTLSQYYAATDYNRNGFTATLILAANSESACVGAIRAHSLFCNSCVFNAYLSIGCQV